MNAAADGSDVSLLELCDAEVASTSNPGTSSLAGVNWAVQRNDFWVVGGLLGSGKSDLLSTLVGVLPLNSGRLLLDGAEITGRGGPRADAGAQFRTGLVHDGGLLFAHLSVAENVALPLQYHHNVSFADAADRAGAWLEAVGMGGMAELPSTRISRNWAQRASLARACILQPEILLLDNPLTGLDPVHARWWMDFLGQLWTGHPLMAYRRATLIATCDDFSPWWGEGRRFAMLSNGRFRTVVEPISRQELSDCLAANHR
ncbi:MAG: ATP-binding cassette domain-containing protein [Verrucomicrobia bacterium]|nr:ATP-binding cassette domain-containing protein [Verrucomicrobiota bacterium]